MNHFDDNLRARDPALFCSLPKTSIAARVRVLEQKPRGFHFWNITGLMLIIAVANAYSMNAVCAAVLRAGAAKVDITDTDAKPVNDPLFVKALVIGDGSTTVAIVTVDAVAIGEIGHIQNDYLGNVRSRIEKELNIRPANIMVSASHCHGIVCRDMEERTFEAVKKAARNRVAVKVGVGVGHENRIMENRRLKLKNGTEVDVRHAYSLPPDDEVASSPHIRRWLHQRLHLLRANGRAAEKCGRRPGG